MKLKKIYNIWEYDVRIKGVLRFISSTIFILSFTVRFIFPVIYINII